MLLWEFDERIVTVVRERKKILIVRPVFLCPPSGSYRAKKKGA
jgi:hypothetical protein